MVRAYPLHRPFSLISEIGATGRGIAPTRAMLQPWPARGHGPYKEWNSPAPRGEWGKLRNKEESLGVNLSLKALVSLVHSQV